jgi:hypothetical protein
VCQVAAYLKAAKPRSKIILLDENADVISKGPLFKKAWSELYGGMIDYRPNSKAVDVDWKGRTVKLEFGDQKGDVLNVIPPQRAGDVAKPFITANNRWCEVDWTTFESKAHKDAHVLGDALQVAPADAQVRQHGERPRPDLRDGRGGAAERPGAQSFAHAHQHLLQHGLGQAGRARDRPSTSTTKGPDHEDRCRARAGSRRR